jgi:hypothetical protein
MASNSIVRISQITRSIYGSRLQTMQFLGLPYTHWANTTLNEKFDVQAGVVPANAALPRVRYFCIGNRGHRIQAGADGQPYTSPIKHSATDAALYGHLPFVLRKVTEDLSPVERARYAMRTFVMVRGVQYVAYYLRRLDFSNVVPQAMLNTKVNGVVNSEPFVPTGANLNPSPSAIPPTGVVTTDGTTVSVSAVLNMSFTENEVSEFMNAVNILFENPYYGVISEVGLVAGVDQQVQMPLPGGGTSGSYLEALGATICTFISDNYPVAFANRGFDFNLDMGASEPLYTLDNG